MLRLLHINQQENINKKFILKKSFTLVELIVSLAIGTTLIMGSFNVLTQSLETISATTVAGTMDNYAFAIQKKIRSELITAKYIDLATTTNASNILVEENGRIVYKNLFYANKNELNFGIIYNEAEGRVSAAYFPQLNKLLPVQDQVFREVKLIFSEEGANGVTIDGIKWYMDDYNVNAENYNNPDYNKNPSRLISYQVILRKSYSNGKKDPLIKVYNFKEVLECAL